MSVRKTDDGNWEAYASYKDPISNKAKTKHKRGFKTKREAKAWEESFKNQAKNSPEMTLNDFWKKYLEYIKPRVKKTTYLNKIKIVEAEILPTFGDKKLSEIDVHAINNWQQNLIKKENKKFGGTFKNSYVRTIEIHFSAMLNHAVKFYNLPSNPLKITGRISKSEAPEMNFWTQEEFEKFAEELLPRPRSHAIYMLLFWTGLRVGEALALRPKDLYVDPKNHHTYMSIRRNYQRVDGEDIFQSPKTKTSERDVPIPDFVAQEIYELIKSYNIPENERIFQISISTVSKEMIKCSASAGVKKIRVHDLRHSYISMLFADGYNVVDIANLVGQKPSGITFRYAHAMPNANDSIVNDLERRGRRK